ncbi:AAA family ATPase [Conexibacter sp. W3-3-2]|uniref:AAA family ATPase n=1 Tax=Conexibacter sp. W3-3-2 TaxID=2675227 RepID=UPI0012B97B7F|nr:SMC family ATPase [Conexibacter sp. W3-3-2]MTD43478.1 AAA family ATPase [Conexibacter sp. W3-3-2]
MRLHRLELRAFLAFPAREVVDFDALNEAGLFLLTGRTGAGKTAILDAICFALYGQVPGTRGIRRLRSDHAELDEPTEVVLELTVRGRRLRVTRRPEQERRALRGGGRTLAKAEVRLEAVDPDGSVALLANRHEEVGQELQDALGMTRDQFCQVVLLPQGGFQRFLHAPTKEREPLLRELFDVARFGDLERWLDGRRVDAVRAAEQAVRAIRDVVSAAAHVVATAPEGTLAAPPLDAERDPAAAEGWLSEQAVVAEAQATTATEALAQSVAAREAAEQAHATARDLHERQAQARAAAEALAAWEARADAREAARVRRDAARAAAPAQALVAAWEDRTARAAAAAQEARDALAAARAADVPLPALDDLATVAPALGALADRLRTDAGGASALLPIEEQVESERLAVDALRRRADALARERTADEERLRTARAAVADLEARDRDAQAAGDRLDALRETAGTAEVRARDAARRDALEEQVRTAQLDHTDARERAVAAREAHQTLLRQHLDGMAAVLAARLRDGEPCAVCGATEHPVPAHDHASVDADAVEAAARHADELTAVRDRRAEELATIRADLAAATGAAGAAPLPELRAAAETAAQAVAEATATAAQAGAVAEQLGERRTAVAALEERIRAAALEHAALTADADARGAALETDLARVRAARAGAPSLTARVASLTQAATTADEAASAVAAAVRATGEAQDAQDAAADAAGAAGFDDLPALRAALLSTAELAELDARIETYDTGLVERRAASGRPELVAALAQPPAAVEASAAAWRGAKAAEGEALALREAAVSRRGQLRGLAQRLTAAIEHSRPLLEQRALLTDLAELATGRGAANRLNMSLSVYVLAARLEEVAAAATDRLLEMTDGRYALEHADDTAKGRSLGGLDLVVIDHWNGTTRSPSTLSGGETFMASLALALGLADVVAAQTGGVRLETLFVDEGFGSLDDEGTLDGVLEALDALREGGRTVGVVSHVGELRQRIPTQLRVERGRNGSRIRAATTLPA